MRSSGTKMSKNEKSKNENILERTWFMNDNVCERNIWELERQARRVSETGKGQYRNHLKTKAPTTFDNLSDYER